MTGDLLLADIVDSISRAIEEEPNFDKRRKLKDARNLIRDVLWGSNVVVQEAIVPPREQTLPGCEGNVPDAL